MSADLQSSIEAAWADRGALSPDTKGEARAAVEAAIDLLDTGAARIADPLEDGQWRVNQWLKKAVLLSFRLNPNRLMAGAEGAGPWWDKVALKTAGWSASQFAQAGFRAAPPVAVRRGAYVAPNAVLMPSYVNIGAYIGAGAMIDIWSCIGSCAQIGANCHISANVTIGGVLEPLQADPVIIEDDCFIGAQSAVAEGVRVRRGAVVAMGVQIGASTPIHHRETGETIYGEVPEYAVVAPGARPLEGSSHAIACAVIMKTVDEKTRARTSVNELLRA